MRRCEENGVGEEEHAERSVMMITSVTSCWQLKHDARAA
jgi:hypothetical protein